jgi:hypothetical protein
MRARVVPAGGDLSRPPAELRRFDVRDWWDGTGDVDHGQRVAHARQRHTAACAAWTAATGLPVHLPAAAESWRRYWQRVGPPPAGSAEAMRARLVSTNDHGFA